MLARVEVDLVRYKGRAERYAYAARRFKDVLRGRILDVGCDKAYLRKLLPPEVEYVGTDVGGAADCVIDLEKEERLPFPDARFDCVICTDVLEHLDSFQRVFDELVRVSGRYLIISLPNCWRALRTRLGRGRGTPHYYGLPPERPPNRHKWFFNVADVVAFMEAQTRRHPVRIVDFTVCEKPRLAPIRWIRRAIYPSKIRYLNRYSSSIWTLLEKTDGSGKGDASGGAGEA